MDFIIIEVFFCSFNYETEAFIKPKIIVLYIICKSLNRFEKINKIAILEKLIH